MAEGIETDEAVRGGEPRIAGTRITLRHVHRLAESGLSPAAIAERHDLSVSDVHRALAYSHEHADELAAIDDQEARRERDALDDGAVSFDAITDGHA
jgi:uncharacterized protein (DUF433 family)